MTTTRIIRVDRAGAAADEIALGIVEQSARLIRVDGHSASGKTGLSKQLARVLGGIHVETDAYLVGPTVRKQQLIENVAQYVATGLYVIVEGIRLEERLPSAVIPTFRILVSSDFEAKADRVRSATIASELGVDRYFDKYRPDYHADIEVVVRVISEHAALLAALQKMG